jgi:PAS domain-containing protein
MAGSGDQTVRTRARLAALLADASTSALGAAGGRVAGVYLRSSTPGLLRLAVLVGLPGPLFKSWWRLHVGRPFPVADAYRLGVQVVLPNAAETVRRYPQFAAGLPFPFGSVHVPVPGGEEPLGVLTVLRPAVADSVDELLDPGLLSRLAEGLGAELLGLADGNPGAVVWDGEPLCVRPPASLPARAVVGRFSWDPATSSVRADDRLHTLLGLRPGEFAGTEAALADAVAPADAHRILAALRDTAAGRPPGAPLALRSPDGTPRLLDLWSAVDDGATRIGGVVFDPGPAASADGAADLLPQGVFCLDRLGLIVYANRAGTGSGCSGVSCGRPCPGWPGRRTTTICGALCCPRTRCTSMCGGRPPTLRWPGRATGSPCPCIPEPTC